MASVPSITVGQITESLLAIPAFTPMTVCVGYLVAWFTNFHDFRQRSWVERIFWSVPLSIGLSTTGCVLLGRFLSLTSVATVLIACVLLWLIVLVRELLKISSAQMKIRFQPSGGKLLLIGVIWSFITVLSLVDWQRQDRLFESLTFFDHGARVNWAESILRTGIPPANPLYFEHHVSNLRYYYFWLVDCAVIAKISHLPVRSILIASCVWSGFCLVALLGLYLKYFLGVGSRLRSQFLLSIGLLAITGPYIVVHLWDIFIVHRAPPGIEVWPEGQITSWIDNLYFYPHHVVSMVCCMFAFLLAWMAAKEKRRLQITSKIVIGFLFASAFGLSVYVAFAFFLIMIAWGGWQLIIERVSRPIVTMAVGGMVGALLLIPYLQELRHGTSKTHGGGVFGFAIRETISPAGLLAMPLLQNVSTSHPVAAHRIAKLVLMLPAYAIELGFYSLVLVAYLARAWRGRAPLTAEHRTLLFIILTTFPIISFIRSEVLAVNDFGIHGGIFVEFPLLLLASELLMSWNQPKLGTDTYHAEPEDSHQSPLWFRSGVRILISLGALSTLYIALILRFGILALPDPLASNLFHKAYFSNIGYAHLNAHIARDAVVQFNPVGGDGFWKNVDLINIDHQSAIASNQLWCGSELGGDPTECPGMIAAIVPLFQAAGADEARAVCRTYGIQYLVANVYDPVWNDHESWVWKLPAVTADPDFRALRCGY